MADKKNQEALEALHRLQDAQAATFTVTNTDWSNVRDADSFIETANYASDGIRSSYEASEGARVFEGFRNAADRFFYSVNRNTTGENRFNAAEFFAERKRQADALKERAASVSKYIDDHAASYTQEAYDSMMAYLSSFNTQVDDALSLYQPSLDASTGLRAYEDEFLAAMERNEQLNDLDRMAAFAFDPNSYAYQSMRQGRHTEGDRGVKDTWTAEQRYRLGQMQMEDPNAARKYAGQVNAGQDPYLLYQQQEQQKADWRAMDLEAEKREIDSLKAELDAHNQMDFDFTSSSARKAFDQESRRLEQEISAREQQYNLAKREQESAQFKAAADRMDFAAKSGYVNSGFEMPAYIEDADPDALVYEYINDPEIRSQINQQTTELAAKGYDLLTPEEVGIYNYYYTIEGPVKAQQYLDNIQNTLNQRFGDRGTEAKKGDLWKQLMAGAIAGFSNAVTSPQYFFDKDSEYINTSPFQYMSAAIREDLADTGPVLPGVPGGASLGQMAYDLVNTTANMGPSILLSTAAGAINPVLGKVVGAATMGSSAAGGSYQQALNAGYSKDQARAYAALSGASEIGLEYLLGGISKLGGEIPQKVLNEIVSGIDNAVAKAAITIGGSMVSEGFEEGLQEVINPWIENLTLYADKDVDWNEVAYSTLLGALSGGVMEGPGVISNESRVSKVNQQLTNLGAKGNTRELAELIVKHRSGGDMSQEEYIKLVKSEPAMQILEGMRSGSVDEDATPTKVTAGQVETERQKVSTEGRSIQISTQQAIDVNDFSEVKDGKATIQLKDGGTVDYSDVSFSSAKEANQFYAVESLPAIDTENANNLLHTIQDADLGKDTMEVVAIREAYRLGYMGAKESELRSSDAKLLDPKLQDAIYAIGKQQRTDNDLVRATARALKTEPTKGYKKVTIEGKLSRPKNREAAQKRKAEIAYIDRIADTFSGTVVHIYESYKKNGKIYYKDNSGKEQLAPNGKYVNGEIWLDLNSGDNQEGLVLNTFAHEMYHHIEEWNKPKARELAEFVVRELGLESVDKAVAAQIEKARAAGYGEDHFVGMTKEQAWNEVYMRAMSDFVADSLETMFTRGDPAKAIANLKNENRSLFDEIKAFIDKWVSKVKEFYSDKTISQEGAVVAQLKNFEQLQQLFMEAMQGAGENYRAAEVTDKKSITQEGDAKYQARRLTDEDLSEYLRAGSRTNKNKLSALRTGQQIILTSAQQIRQFIGNAIDKTLKNNTTVAYGRVNDRLADDVLTASNGKIKIKDDFLELIPDNLRHAYEQHHIAKQTGDIDLSRTDFENIPEYLDSYTEIVYAIEYASGKVGVCVSKRLPNGRILLIEAVSKSRGSLQFKNAIGVSESKYQTDYVNVYKKGAGTNTRGSNDSNNSLRDDPSSKYSIRNSNTEVNTEMNSLRNQKPPTTREILSAVDPNTRNRAEKDHLGRYQERVAKLAELEPQLEEANAKIEALLVNPQKNREELKQLRSEARSLNIQIKALEDKLKFAENTDMMRAVVREEKLNWEIQNNGKDIQTAQRELIKSSLAEKSAVRESYEVQKQRKHVEEKSKDLMNMLAHPTKDVHVPIELQQPLQEFLDSIDFTSRRQARGGTATIKDIAYREALAEVRNAVASQVTAWQDAENGVFELDIPVDFKERIDAHIKAVKDAAKGLDTNTNRVYEMSSAELKDLSYILGVINKAVRDIDKMHMQGERARNSVLAKDTMQEMQRRKPIKGEQGSKFMWNNYIPFHAFRRYGKAGQKIFKGFTAGQAKLSRNVASVLEFSEKTYTAKEVREWEHTRHEIKLDSGKTVTMSPAQIMYFWCLSRRDQAIPHMQGGGMRLTTLEKFVDNAKVQGELVQKDHFTLTLGDVNRINNMLTDRQIEVAQKLQQFMQNVGGKWINEISMARWDFLAATENNYVPIMTEDTGRDVKNPDQNKSSLFALLNKSFTNAPLKNAKNALVVDSLFNVFANHMSETAEYNAFALPLIDALKWFNYRERVDIGDGHINDIGVRRSIEDTLGTEARKYFTDFLTDINSSQKAGRHEDFFGKILGRSKAASVAWNTRVAIQQISALPRASMILNYRSLILGASHFRLKKATEEMKKYSGIALWKSMGYYDLNVAKSVERQIKGDTNFLDKFNEWGMWLPGKMDERTWARIWLAAKSQVRNDTDLTGEELLQATAEKFEEVVYQTQVVDSVLTRSSYMRDKNLFIKEATSFMAEPTLSLNILMSAFQDYEEGHTTKEKVQRGLMIGFTGYALSAIANALLGSFSDAWRDDDEYETFWEKYGQALFGEKFTDGNLFSELNPLEKIMFVKDGLSVARGNEPHSSYSKLLSGAVDLINAYQSAAEGKTSKTAYGVVYQTLQYLSTLSGVGISNLTREAVDVWNNTFGKWNPDKKLVRYESNNGEELLNAIQNGTPEDIQRVFGRFESQKKAESALQHAIREKYVAGEMTEEEAQELLTTNFDRDDEHDVYWILDKWDYAKENGSSEGYTKYGKFMEGVETGDFQGEMDRLMEHGAEASDIRSQVSRTYHKQYLEDASAREEIQKKLQIVYEATGMDEDEIREKFNDWDFEAEYGMTYSEFKAEYRAGDVTENEMRGAMESYGLMNYEIEENIRSLNDDIRFENKYGMSLSDMYDAYDDGDLTRNTLINALVFTGKTRTEAQETVTERDIKNQYGIDYMKLDDAYKHNDISRQTLYNAMIKHGTTKEEADEAIVCYDWLKKNVRSYPDLQISDARRFVLKVSDKMEERTLTDYGVSVDAYLKYKEGAKDCTGVDANGDGKIDSYSKAKQLYAMIDKLPISNEAKDGLALITNAKSTLKKYAPWR